VAGNVDLREVAARLADRRPDRTEANVQADLHLLLLAANLNLTEDEIREPVTLEAPVTGQRRIDVEVGSTVFECKRDLRVGNVLGEAVKQLAGYVRTRTNELGRRYVGVLTDGADWRLFRLDPISDTLIEVASFSLSKSHPDVSGLCMWLESVLATVEGLTPTPREIRTRLGATSTAHALETADLAALYDANRDNPTVALKRELWARLLTTAFGTSFDNSDQLFVEHTLLVVTAELIAHAVVGMDPSDPNVAPAALLSGSRFAESSIGGVVESDFFDWVVEIPKGDQFVRTLARRLARFSWGKVEHDVMKVLYESVIPSAERKKLGEYYTPDWLAQQVVEEVVDEPLTQRVLDPSCGSGTFLFHAVRRVLTAADDAGLSNADAIEIVTSHVMGLDVHPVAVTLARVTYLLAIGWDRLNADDRPGFSVPVYLGDSLQWGQERTLFDSDNLVIPTNDRAELFTDELRFPRVLLADVGNFDRLVAEMADRAAQQGSGASPLKALFRRYAVPAEAQPTIETTFSKMRDLHAQGRDHIWGYFVRNLARPAWLARPENRVDRIVGNPPWLSYRFMTTAMQAEFKDLTRAYGLWGTNASVATAQDLSGLFITRCTQLYLQPGGKFGMVAPNAVLSRRQYAGFRTGRFNAAGEWFTVNFGKPWDLEKIRPIFFPQSSCVVFGTRTFEDAQPLGSEAVQWAGKLPDTNPSWEVAAPHLTRLDAAGPTAHGEDSVAKSPYHARFAQGATFVPNMLLVVEDAPSGSLGAGAGRRHVRSRRSANEKPPWKDLPSQTGTVETQFLRPLFKGEHILPWVVKEPYTAIVPWDGKYLLDLDKERLAEYPGLEAWWTIATTTWEHGRTSERLSLTGQVDYRHKLTDQFPLHRMRVVYSASSINLTAALIEGDTGIIDKSLYWATVTTTQEGRYLEAVLNCNVTLERLQPMQARGKDSPRHVDKYIWQVPIPEYVAGDPLHARLADLGAEAALEAGTVELQPGDFRRQRKQVRQHVYDVGIGPKIDLAVAELLEPATPSLKGDP